MQILQRDIQDVLLGFYHAANPEFPLGRDEEKFVTRHAGPFRRLAAQQAQLVIQDRFVRVDFFPGALPLDHPFDEIFQRFRRAALHPVETGGIGVNEADFRRNSAGQARFQHSGGFRERVLAKHARDVEADFRVLEVVELWQDRFERLFRNGTGRHPIDADLHYLQAGLFQFPQTFARQEKTIRRQARRKTELPAIAH